MDHSCGDGVMRGTQLGRGHVKVPIKDKREEVREDSRDFVRPSPHEVPFRGPLLACPA